MSGYWNVRPRRGSLVGFLVKALSGAVGDPGRNRAQAGEKVGWIVRLAACLFCLGLALPFSAQGQIADRVYNPTGAPLSLSRLGPDANC